MLPQNFRIQTKKEIERVLKYGKSRKENFLVLKTIKNNLGQMRFGFIVSKKISKSAVARNKIKRKLNELIRAELKTADPGSFFSRTGTDNLIIVLPGVETQKFSETKTALKKIFQKI